MGNESGIVRIPVAAILRRRPVDHPWLSEEWQAVGLLPQPPAEAHGRLHRRLDDGEEYLAACPPLELHPKDAESYAANLASANPAVWVLMDEEESAPPLPLAVHMATVSAFEAQDYLDSGELRVDMVPMPDALKVLVEAFVAAQPEPAPFCKRRNRKEDAEAYRFGKEPIAELRRRLGREPGGAH